MAEATIPVYHAAKEEPWRVSLFVAMLGASSYAYAEAARDRQLLRAEDPDVIEAVTAHLQLAMNEYAREA